MYLSSNHKIASSGFLETFVNHFLNFQPNCTSALNILILVFLPVNYRLRTVCSHSRDTVIQNTRRGGGFKSYCRLINDTSYYKSFPFHKVSFKLSLCRETIGKYHRFSIWNCVNFDNFRLFLRCIKAVS